MWWGVIYMLESEAFKKYARLCAELDRMVITPPLATRGVQSIHSNPRNTQMVLPSVNRRAGDSCYQTPLHLQYAATG